MRKLLIPLVVGVIILVTQVVTGVSAQTPNYLDYEVSIPYVAFTEPPVATPTDAAVDDGTWEAERPRSHYCSAEALAANPQDLDPLGIFATPAPMPTPEPLPTAELTPEPTPTVVPTPEATETVVAP